MHSPYREGRKTKKGERRSILNAAAFQDHMARLISLPSAGTGPVSTSGVQAVRETSTGRGGSHPRAEREETEVTEVVGRGHRLTLAQKRGLVAAPRSKLDEYEWLHAHAQSLQRGDLQHGCTICYEEFRGEDRVLLSCSHTFHKHCLDAFERFTKQRCCPLCRTLQYQKRVVANAREMYEEECAIVIQKHYRRRLAKKRFDSLLSMRVPEDPAARQEWCAAKLSETNDRLLERLEDEDTSIERLLADIDRKIFFSKTAREIADTSLREPLPSTPPSEAEAIGGHGGGDGDGGGDGAGVDPTMKCKKCEVDWEEVKGRARRRKDKTCPICIGPLARKLRGNVCLLTCSHTFHEDCIKLFELFQEAEQAKPICPLCRAPYQKIVVQGIDL